MKMLTQLNFWRLTLYGFGGPGVGGYQWCKFLRLNWFWLVFGLSRMNQKKIGKKYSYPSPISRNFWGVFRKNQSNEFLDPKIEIHHIFCACFLILKRAISFNIKKNHLQGSRGQKVDKKA